MVIDWLDQLNVSQVYHLDVSLKFDGVEFPKDHCVLYAGKTSDGRLKFSAFGFGQQQTPPQIILTRSDALKYIKRPER